MAGVDHDSFEEGRGYRLYRRLLAPVLSHPVMAYLVIGVIGLLLAGSVLLFWTRDVVVKMLPFDNKSELQLVIDMPEGTTLEKRPGRPRP